MGQPELPLRDVVLERLRPEEREFVAERLLLDADWYEAVVAEEQHVVEEYEAGALSATDRRDFERICRARPDLMESVRLIRSIRALPGNRLTGSPIREMPVRPATPQRRLLVWLPAAAMLLLALGLPSVMLFRMQSERRMAADREHYWTERYREQNKKLEALREQARPQDSKPATAGQPGAASRDKASVIQPQPPVTQHTQEVLPEPVLVSVLLQPDVRGAGELPHTAVPAGKGDVELRFTLAAGPPFDSYRILIRDGVKDLLDRANLHEIAEGGSRAVPVRLPGSMVHGGTLGATLYGKRDSMPERALADYHFILDPEVR